MIGSLPPFDDLYVAADEVRIDVTLEHSRVTQCNVLIVHTDIVIGILTDQLWKIGTQYIRKQYRDGVVPNVRGSNKSGTNAENNMEKIVETK